MTAPDPGLRAAVLGATGYVGGELVRLLAGHPAVGEIKACSERRAGLPWSSVHPSLVNLRGDFRFEACAVEQAAAWADVLFLALPHGESQKLFPALGAGLPRLLIDTAADFRLKNLERTEATYGPHEVPAELGSFACGLADVAGTSLAGADRIAIPGCFATAALLALWPLAPVLDRDSDPVCWAATGSSGSGAIATPTTHHPRRANNLYAYSLGGHRHEAELAERLEEWCGADAPRCSLLTHSAPIVRGIHATLRVRLREAVTEPLDLLRAAYGDRPFIQVLDHPPEVAPVAGTNHAHLGAVARAGGREVLVLCTIDNLVKGAAGQAVQAMNLALGLEETAGLGFPGMAPC